MGDKQLEVEGNRLIDVDIFSRNIFQLVCGFCHGDVQLLELKQQGLGSELVFHCTSRKCNGQRSFPSCDKIAVGNLSVNSVNRRAASAIRCIGGAC